MPKRTRVSKPQYPLTIVRGWLGIDETNRQVIDFRLTYLLRLCGFSGAGLGGVAFYFG